MQWHPHVTVAALAERDGKFLLVEESIDGRTLYNQPAGHLERGESLIDAVVRETLEETAYRFTPEALVGVYRWTHPQRDLTYLRFAFCGRVGDHDPARPLDAGIQRALWLDRATVARPDFAARSPLVLRVLDDYLAGQRHPLALLHDVAG